MGNLFTKSSATTPKDTVTDMEVSNLKLEAAKITEFHGRSDGFRAWRIRTGCAFHGSGFERILTDQPFSMANPRMNRIVFSQLSVATANGDAYHLVLKHNNTKNGHGAWNELLNWYDGDAVRSETADTLRVKLHNLKLREPTSGSQYINCFNQYIHHLDRIHGEGMSESHKIQIFIRNIEDDDYMDVALHLRNSEVQSLEKAISAIRKRERDLREIKGKRKTPFLTRRIDQSEIAPEWQTQIRAANDGMGRPIRRLDTVRLTQGDTSSPPRGHGIQMTCRKTTRLLSRSGMQKWPMARTPTQSMFLKVSRFYLQRTSGHTKLDDWQNKPIPWQSHPRQHRPLASVTERKRLLSVGKELPLDWNTPSKRRMNDMSCLSWTYQKLSPHQRDFNRSVESITTLTNQLRHAKPVRHPTF